VAPWQEADLHPYQVTAAQLAAVIENRRQQRLLVERGRRLAVLEERQRLARDLHDAVTQSVFSVSLIAQSILPAVRRDPDEGERRITRLIEQSQTAMRELRAVLAELRPPDGDPVAGGLEASPDLTTALEELLERVRDHGIDAGLDAGGYRPQPQAQERIIFRICQEALSNVIKHARARSVTVTLQRRRGGLWLTIGDDGVGLPRQRGQATAAGSLASGGMGLRSMRERAEEAGGRFAVRSRRGAGTRIEVVLPIRDGGR
jgi:signal transduction histidine kinase